MRRIQPDGMPARRYFYGAAALAALLLLHRLVAQNPPPNAPPQGAAEQGAPLSPQQLDDLVAPIALYPDPLVAEILAAATYPMEIAEAQQWVQDHAKWKPSKLMDEAKKQKWDPSVQGLAAFPYVLSQLTQNMGWTTQLGNAFLAQQAAVMQAVQHMRAEAEAKGKLQSTPQQTVTSQDQNGQPEIVIEPADPNIWYVPNYNPVYIWGPPAWGFYPPLIYPGIGIGFGWFPGIDIGLYFGGWGGWGWGGWGWYPNWWGGNLFIDRSFFHRYGFAHFHDGGMGRSPWVHDPAHRLGVPYANRQVASRFGGNAAGDFRGAPGASFNSTRNPGTARSSGHLGNPGFEQRGWTGSHSVFGGYHNGGATRIQSDHGFSSLGAGRTFGGGGFGGGGFHGGGFGGGGRR
jgi:hypothetical protein